MNSTFPTGPYPTAHGLAPSERLLLLAIRSWLCAHRMGEPPRLRVAPALAAKTSDRAAALFGAWIQAVEAGCLRPIQIRPACCGRLTRDEHRLVTACAAGAHSIEAARSLLEHLLIDTEAVAVLGRALHAALAGAGWRLPAPVAAMAAPVRHTLH